MSASLPGSQDLPVLSCCAPTRLRAEIREQSRSASADRVRVTAGSSEDMIRLDGGSFLMGTEDTDSIVADGEGPVRSVLLDAFLLDRYPVTNERFREFVENEKYVTEAERFGWSFVFHLHAPAQAKEESFPGLQWWRKVDRADWSHPEGPDSSLIGREHHPVTHVSWHDANAYARWAGKRLPSEAEWEYAARGGLEQKRFPWGDELTPGGKHLCNIWQGHFPTHNTAEDGYEGTAPVDAFEPNGFGFLTITGNAWEWCADWFSPAYHRYAARTNPVGPPGEARSQCVADPTSVMRLTVIATEWRRAPRTLPTAARRT